MEKYPHYLERLQNATRKYWDKAALNSIGGESFTYGQMATQIEKFHLVFDKLGIKKGEKIALWARNGARWGMSYLAVNTYETVIVPLLADFTPEGATFLVNHSESIALFTNEDKFKQMDIARMPAVRFVVDIDSWKLLYAASDEIAATYAQMDALFEAKWPDGFGPGDVVYPTDNWDNLSTINYTSGSTGDPKGVMLTYRNFCANVDFSQRHVPAGDKMVSMLPMAHMYGLVIEFIYPLCNGTAIYWLGKAPTPATLLKAFADVKPYLLITVPLVMEKIYKSKIKPTLDKPAVKFLLKVPGVNQIIYKKVKDGLVQAFGGNVEEFIMGGAALNPEVERIFKKIKFPYLVGYGMTEACPLLAYEHWTKYVPGSCGKPVDCAVVRIDSEDPQHIALRGSPAHRRRDPGQGREHHHRLLQEPRGFRQRLHGRRLPAHRRPRHHGQGRQHLHQGPLQEHDPDRQRPERLSGGARGHRQQPAVRQRIRGRGPRRQDRRPGLPRQGRHQERQPRRGDRLRPAREDPHRRQPPPARLQPDRQGRDRPRAFREDAQDEHQALPLQIIDNLSLEQHLKQKRPAPRWADLF